VPTTTTYELGVSGSAFTGAANREDLLDVITIISPVDTPLFTMFRKTKISNVQVEWLTDLLDQATTNAVADGSSATFQSVTSRARLSNYAQISRESYDVSDSQRAVNPFRKKGARRGNSTVNIRLFAIEPEYPEERLAA
jgi:uncharacterized protein DUF5309